MTKTEQIRERDAKWYEMYKSGLSTYKIAKKVNRAQMTVWNAIDRHKKYIIKTWGPSQL